MGDIVEDIIDSYVDEIIEMLPLHIQDELYEDIKQVLEEFANEITQDGEVFVS